MGERIKIAERFVPFTHVPGTLFLIPDTFKTIQIFPAALSFPENGKTIELPVEGPVKNFTVFYDLERQRLQVVGIGKNGYFSYFIKGDQFYLEKGHEDFLKRGFTREPFPKKAKELERISFGVTKKSEWDLVCKRHSLAEILPYIFLQGQLVSDEHSKLDVSIAKDLQEAIREKAIKQVEALFLALIATGFKGVLVPQVIDSSYLGYNKAPISSNCSALAVSKILYQELRSLILSQDLELVPLICKLFPSGRVQHLKTSFGKIDLEWTKGNLRKLWIFSEMDTEIILKFPKEYQKLRLNKKNQSIVNQTLKVALSSNQFYFFDKFC